MQSTNNKKLIKELSIFFIVTIVVTWLFWLPALLIKNFNVSIKIPYDIFLTIGIFVPSILGFIFAYIFGGKGELKQLFKSLINVKIKLKWYLFIFLVLPLVSAISCLIYYLLKHNLPEMPFKVYMLPIVFIYILVLMGPLGEEVGWRGFALKRILQKFSLLNSAIILGIIWSIWHLPLFFIEGTTQNNLMEFGALLAILGYFLYTTMISILITILFINSKKSVFGAILIHTMANMSLGVVLIIFSKTGALILINVLLITTAIFIILNKKVMLKPLKNDT